MHVDLYSDGASRGNPGPGGYGSILRFVDSKGGVHEREFSQGYRCTTNNRMELLGAIVALEALKRPCHVTLYSDSQYLVIVQPALGGRLAQARVEELAEAAGEELRSVEAHAQGQGAS